MGFPRMYFQTSSPKIQSPFQSSQLFYPQSSELPKRKLFTQYEDHLLTQAAYLHNENSWNEIAKMVPGRTPRQCRDRWKNYLKPTLRFDPWKKEDDELLVSLVNTYGTHWTKMKESFPGRSTNALKNRWHWLLNNFVQPMEINDSENDKYDGFLKIDEVDQRSEVMASDTPNIKNPEMIQQVPVEDAGITGSNRRTRSEKNEKSYYFMFNEKKKKNRKANKTTTSKDNQVTIATMKSLQNDDKSPNSQNSFSPNVTEIQTGKTQDRIQANLDFAIEFEDVDW